MLYFKMLGKLSQKPAQVPPLFLNPGSPASK
jgi:hypothetical protein